VSPHQAWRAHDKAIIEIDGQRLLPHIRVNRSGVDQADCFTKRY
jgi:hypothetical protein